MPKLKCCGVKHCPSQLELRNRRFFSFPLNYERREKWIAFCQNSSLKILNPTNLINHYYVCDLHFKSEDFKNKQCQSLSRSSVPSINGPESFPVHSMATHELKKLDAVTKEHSYYISATSSSPTPLPLHCQSPTLIDHPHPTSQINNDSPIVNSLSNQNPPPSSIVLPCKNVSALTPCLLPSKSKSFSFNLSNLNMTRKTELQNARMNHLYEYAKKKEKALKRLRKKYQQRKNESLSINDVCRLKQDDYKYIKRLSNKMSKTFTTLLLSQLKLSKRKPKGRRWTVEDKIIALSILKRGPKVYRLLRCMFTLPSERTINTLLSSFPFGTGINERIFSSLAKTVDKMDDRDKLCCLLFDEMAISEHLNYNKSLDLIEGVEDHGGQGSTGRCVSTATHALVFMLSGLLKKWKQPVAFYFTSIKGISSEKLIHHITEVLHASINAGLCVVATVCDLGGSNVKALKLLGSTKDSPVFTFEGRKIITLYDPPHLIKCTRNMLQKHKVQSTATSGNLAYIGNGQASWQHITEAYERDKTTPGPFRSLWKLTDTHLNPKFKKKMKVKLATQTLSHSVAACIMKYVTQGLMDEDAMATAYFVGLCDQLFDSFNGTQRKDDSGKKFKCWITRSSPHLEFWDEASRIIDGWKFVSSKTGKIIRPWSQDGWLTTIEGMKRLWDLVSRKMKLANPVFFLVPRSVSQDALENMFGTIRSHCGNNHRPNVGQFVGALKTCIINGLAYQDKKQGPNCQDDGMSLLSNLQTLLTSDLCDTSDTSSGIEGNRKVVTEKCAGDSQEWNLPTDLTATAYVSGFIARKLLASNKCVNCRQGILSSNLSEAFNIGILFKEYSENQERLTYPSEAFVRSVGLCATLLENILEKQFYERKLIKTITNVMLSEIDISWLHYYCTEHISNVRSEIVKSVCKIGVPWWCKKRNRQIYNV